MKVYIDADEWYPMFFLEGDNVSKHYGVEAEITEEQHTKYVRIAAEFDQMQMELSELAKWESR